jgi:hypothetical protein
MPYKPSSIEMLRRSADSFHKFADQNLEALLSLQELDYNTPVKVNKEVPEYAYNVVFTCTVQVKYLSQVKVETIELGEEVDFMGCWVKAEDAKRFKADASALMFWDKSPIQVRAMIKKIGKPPSENC